MHRHKVTRIKRKSKCNKCNAAAEVMEQRHNFPRPKSRSRSRKNSKAKNRILEDKCTRWEIEAGAESEADFATFWLDCSIF